MLLVDDIMTEVEVVAKEEADVEQQQEDHWAEPGPGPSMPRPATDSLEVHHLQLGSVNASSHRASPVSEPEPCLCSCQFGMAGSRGWALGPRSRVAGSQLVGTGGHPGVRG